MRSPVRFFSVWIRSQADQRNAIAAIVILRSGLQTEVPGGSVLDLKTIRLGPRRLLGSRRQSAGSQGHSRANKSTHHWCRRTFFHEISSRIENTARQRTSRPNLLDSRLPAYLGFAPARLCSPAPFQSITDGGRFPLMIPKRD